MGVFRSLGFSILVWLSTASSFAWAGAVALHWCAGEMVEPRSGELRERSPVQLRTESGREYMRIHVIDPFGHFEFAGRNPLFIAFSDPDLEPRLQLLDFLLRRRNRHVYVRISHWDTQVRYVVPHQPADFTHLFLDFAGDQLKEDPNAALSGLAVELLFDELWQSEPLAKLMNALLDEQTERFCSSHACPDRDDVRRQILEILQLRTTWVMKIESYHQFQIARQSSLFPSWRTMIGSRVPASYYDFMDYVTGMETGSAAERRAARDRQMNFLKERFIEFYAVDPRLVDLVWNQKLPDGWDFPLAVGALPVLP